MSAKIKGTTFQKLILVGGAVFLVLLGAFLFTGNYIRGTAEESMRQVEEGMMEQMVKKFDSYHHNMIQIISSMAYSPTVYSCFFQDSTERVTSNEAVSMVFANTFLMDSSIADIFLYDKDMARIASAGKETEELEELDFLQEWKTQLGYSGLFELPVTQEPCYTLFFPVFELESKNFEEQIGLCVVVVKTQELMEILKDAQLSSGEELYLIDRDRRILASAQGEEAKRLDQEEGDGSAVSCPYVRELAIDGWTLVLKRRNAGLYREISKEMGLIAAAYLLAAILVLLLLVICYRNLVRPIQEMDDFVGTVSWNPKLRIEVKDKNEIGKVEQGLNQMLDNIERKNAQLQEMKEWAYQTELAKKQLQILVYQNQIHPHFLYNTLDCIRAMAVLNDQKPIAAITMALSRMFRFAVREEHIVAVEEEISYVREYAKIIDYRFNGKIKIQIEAEEQAAARPMIKMILQPIIENAVFHGLERNVGGGTVTASVAMARGDRLCLKVEDNGCGMSEEKLKVLRNSLAGRQKGQGIGLPNVYQRLKLFYGEDMDFFIDSRENEGTSVRIEFADNIKDRRDF